MLIFSAYLSYRAFEFKIDGKSNIFLVCYIGCYDISSQQTRQIQAYHRKLIVISMLPFTAEKEIFVIQSCKQ